MKKEKKLVTLKRVEKRLENVESWVKDFNNNQGPKQTMDNLNWLVGQTRMLGDRLSQAEEAVANLQKALQSNNEILQAFLEAEDKVQVMTTGACDVVASVLEDV